MAVEGVCVVDLFADDVAWRWMVLRYLGDIPCCSRCGVEVTGPRALKTFWSCQRTWCAACGSRFNPMDGTPISGTSWGPGDYVRLQVLLAASTPIKMIADHLEKSPASVRDMIERCELIHTVGTFDVLVSRFVNAGIKRERAAEGEGLDF